MSVFTCTIKSPVNVGQGWWHMPVIPAFGRNGASSRPAWGNSESKPIGTMWSDPVSTASPKYRECYCGVQCPHPLIVTRSSSLGLLALPQSQSDPEKHSSLHSIFITKFNQFRKKQITKNMRPSS